MTQLLKATLREAMLHSTNPLQTSACGSHQGHWGYYGVWELEGGGGGLLLFLTFKDESEKSLTLKWSQAWLKVAANYQHMCCSGKNITDQRLLFAFSTWSHVTAGLLNVMKA